MLKRLDDGFPNSGAISPSQAPDKKLRLLLGDCREQMKLLKDESVHFALADPPYFLDGLDDGWKKGAVDTLRATGSVGGLPVGMRFDPKDGFKLQKFITEVATELIRVLKPGSFATFFSQPRLSHRMAAGIEDAGFEIRDVYAWRFTKRAQFKAFSLNHLVDQANLPENERLALLRSLKNKKTPQLRPQFEVIILCQKPKDGTHLTNWQRHKTGLINASATLDGMAPSTIMTVEKPDKDQFNFHPTVKPLQLVSHLIRLFSLPNQTVIDPFIGSGTTALAARKLGRFCVGIDISEQYLDICRKRLAAGEMNATQT